MFKGGTGGRGGRSLSASFPPCAGLASVFYIVFVLYLNDLPSEASSVVYILRERRQTLLFLIFLF